MKQFLVGGAVRDRLMGLVPTDRDWVVVGAQQHNIEKMISNGYKQVGNDFPVFLHPKSGEEYALARTERKVSVGYNGFECNYDPSVTLNEDLLRRDLTINAIAYDPYTNETFDPYGGVQDIKNKILRHVSPAYAEDPVRVLRTARFAARYNFKIHPSTKTLMSELVDSGELDHLTEERVILELKKVSQQSTTPSIFFKVLEESGAFRVLFPGVVGYNLTILDSVVRDACLDASFDVMMAVLLHNCNNIVVGDICTKYKLSQSTYRYIMDSKNHGTTFTKLHKMSASDIVSFFDSMSLRNKGGEDYVYLLLDIQYAFGKITKTDQDVVLRYYDQYYSTDLSNIDEMCKKKGSKWVKTELKPYIFSLKCANIEKMDPCK